MASKKSAIVLPGSKVLKHIVFVRFNDGITDEQIEKFIKDYAHVADVVEPVKGFGWGKNYPVQQLNHDYLYGFELSFDSQDAFNEYLQSPALTEFNAKFLPACASRMIMDYYLF
ncbi:hypothetical protein H0E87_019296 [Populus deltoides]|uniref:Stress-response A/B barrel domain-containing protein n=1 Tax=Populus deltoides TaxID=3696 RepID=A0A8T2XTP6_POPDE|nr:hypothetical protein H0E87_019296 [Populus deltoides]